MEVFDGSTRQRQMKFARSRFERDPDGLPRVRQAAA